MGSLRPALAGLVLAAAFASPAAVRADTVASLLGNFTINQYCSLQLARAPPKCTTSSSLVSCPR